MTRKSVRHIIMGRMNFAYMQARFLDVKYYRDIYELIERFRAGNAYNLIQVCGENVPFQIAEFARLSGVPKIVVSRSFAYRAESRKIKR